MPCLVSCVYITIVNTVASLIIWYPQKRLVSVSTRAPRAQPSPARSRVKMVHCGEDLCDDLLDFLAQNIERLVWS
jgi:hypothetical protein